jgi:hypothetical protein
MDLKVVNEKFDKNGKLYSKQISIQNKNKTFIKPKQVNKIYKSLTESIPAKNIRVLVTNPYLNYFTLKTGENGINMDDDDYWANKPEDVKNKIEQFSMVHFVIKY